MSDKNQRIFNADTSVDPGTGRLSGKVAESEKLLSQLKGVFLEEEKRAEMPQDTVVYRVQTHQAEAEGKAGGLLFGTSFVSSGRVGDEYFMTKGHYHAKIDTAEYYWCIRGQGMLILMEEDGTCYAEEMRPGSLHYIRGRVAHRIANTGSETLAVGACWPSDAGHDYDTILKQGFTARLLCVDGKPILVRKDESNR